MLLLTRYTLLTGLVAARLSLSAELIVLRYSRIDVPRCVLFIALVVTRFSLLIAFTRRLLHTFRSILLAASFTFYHLTVHYSLVPFCCYLSFTGHPLFAVCFLFLAACLFSSYLAALTVCCSLIPSSLITSHLLLVGVASRRPLIAERSSRIVPRYSLRDTRFSQLTSPHSVAAGSSIFDLYCSLPAGHSSLVASNIMFLITRSSLKMPAIMYTRSAFRCSVLVFPCSFPAARFFSLLVS